MRSGSLADFARLVRFVCYGNLFDGYTELTDFFQQLVKVGIRVRIIRG